MSKSKSVINLTLIAAAMLLFLIFGCINVNAATDVREGDMQVSLASGMKADKGNKGVYVKTKKKQQVEILTLTHVKNTGAVNKANVDLIGDKLIDTAGVDMNTYKAERGKIDGLETVDFQFDQTIDSSKYKVNGFAVDYGDYCYILKYAVLDGKNSSYNKIRKSVKVGKNEKKVRKLKIVDSGYSIEGDDEGLVPYYVYYGVVIANPNKNHAVELPTFRITAYKSDGSVLDTEDQSLFNVPAGDTVGYGFQALELNEKPAKVDIKMLKHHKYDVKKGKGKRDIFDVSGVSLTQGEFGNYSLNGTLINLTKKDYESVSVTAIFRDNNMNIVSGTSTFVESVGPKSTSPFSVDIDMDNIGSSDYDIFVQDWS